MDIHCKMFFSVFYESVRALTSRIRLANLVCKTNLKATLLLGQMGINLFI